MAPSRRELRNEKALLLYKEEVYELAGPDEPPLAGTRAPGARCWFLRFAAGALATAALLGCAVARPWRGRRAGAALGQQGGQAWGQGLVELFEPQGEEPAVIYWKKHPTKCWALPPEMKNAMHLRIRECGDSPDKFLIPASGTGAIRSAEHPEFCVDAVKGSPIIQYWRCADSPEENLIWVLPEGRDGDIKPNHTQTKCCDVPGGKTADDTLIQQWACRGGLQQNEQFVIKSPDDCKWEDWSVWGDCTMNCTQESRSRKTASVGKFCNASVTERRACDKTCKKSAKDGGARACGVSRVFVLGACLLLLPSGL